MVGCKPFAPSYVRSTSLKAGVATELAVKRKRNLYNYVFVALGPWSNEAKDFIGKLGSMLVQETGDNCCKKSLRQQISVTIQRGGCCNLGIVNCSNFIQLINMRGLQGKGGSKSFCLIHERNKYYERIKKENKLKVQCLYHCFRDLILI